MTISVKKATLDDVEAVAELFNSYRIFYKQEADIDLAVSFISERIENQESVIFYAHDEEGHSLGFIQLYPSFSSVSAKRSWVLNDLFVSSSSRRLGVAKKLMETAKIFASESNANGIALETGENNVNAQALYESLGYKKGSGYYNYFLSLS